MDNFLLWLGTEMALGPYLRALQDPGGSHLRLFRSDDDDEDTKDETGPYVKLGGVGLVRIAGSLTNRDAWYNSLLGLMSYNEIRNAVVAAASDSSIHTVLLDIDSGGGTVAGVMDAANLIADVDKKVKPVHAFTAASMHSAAYFLGAAARKVYTTDLGSVGSIGAIMVHFDQTKRLDEAGIKPTVIRSAELKAIGNPFEKLTDDRRAVLQGQIDYVHGVFVDHVARHRSLDRGFVARKLATGEEFMGQQAVDSRAVDGIMSLDTLVEKLNKNADNGPRGKGIVPTVVGTRASSSDETKVTEDHVSKKILSAAAQAAIAEGADPATASEIAPETPATDETIVPGTETTTTPSAASDAAPAGEPKATEQAPASDSQVVEFLRSELSAANARITALTVENTETKNKLSAVEASQPALRKIAEASHNRMVIALGGTPIDLSAVPDEALLQMHAKTLTQFTNKFRIGGVVDNGDTTTGAAPAPVTGVKPAQLRAVRPAS